MKQTVAKEPFQLAEKNYSHTKTLLDDSSLFIAFLHVVLHFVSHTVTANSKL
ncbi:MAG: hypothetical protein LBM95_05160 [Lactobacillales bacterium]|nr:hypothetical protein [Lactobacillales bacterium]